MASAAAVKKRLQELLPTVNLETTTEKQIREQLAAELGPVDKHKKFITGVIEDFLAEAAKALEAVPEEDEEDDDYSEDEEEEEEEEEGGRGGRSGKRKLGKASVKGGAAKSARVDGDLDFSLSGKKRLKLSHFKGKALVDIREYYEKDGELCPGAKGIALTPDQWHVLAAGLASLQAALEKKDTDCVIELSRERRAYVSDFNGRYGVQIREMYEKEGEWLPGKKGVMLDATGLDIMAEHAQEMSAALPAPTGAQPTANRESAAASTKREDTGSRRGKQPAASRGESSETEKDYVELGGHKRISVQVFQGRVGVDLREYYVKGDQELPGNKGIRLSVEDWELLAKGASAISKAATSKDMKYILKLSGMRQVSISEFKGSTYVGVREYYEKGGKLLPGAKGLNMSNEQWAALVAAIPAVKKLLSKH